MEQQNFYLLVETPTNSLQRNFLVKWADITIANASKIPAFSEPGLLIKEIKFQLSECYRKLQCPVKPTAYDLLIVRAKMLEKAIHHPNNIPFKIELAKITDDKFAIYPGNLSSLVFLAGLEYAPKHLGSSGSHWQSDVAIYTFASSRNCCIQQGSRDEIHFVKTLK